MQKEAADADIRVNDLFFLITGEKHVRFRRRSFSADRDFEYGFIVVLQA
jgi:hypothetical protein